MLKAKPSPRAAILATSTQAPQVMRGLTLPLMQTVDPQLNEAVKEATPLGRFGTPEDVASLAVFLTSPEADFITGQVCDVSGGWLMT